MPLIHLPIDKLFYLLILCKGLVLLFLQELICLLALTIAPPLGEEPVLGLEVTKPPWQFVWIYALENLWVPSLIVAPPIIIGFLLAVPIVDQNKERYWKKRPLAIAVLVGFILIFAALIIWGRVTTMTHSM